MFRNLNHLISITTILLSTTLGSLATRYYEILNNCPQTIQIYVNGESQGSVDAQKAITHNYQDDFSGFIYSDANGAVTNGTWHMTRAAFNGTVSSNFSHFVDFRFSVLSTCFLFRITITISYQTN
jgi:hypothetical protein